MVGFERKFEQMPIPCLVRGRDRDIWSGGADQITSGFGGYAGTGARTEAS